MHPKTLMARSFVLAAGLLAGALLELAPALAAEADLSRLVAAYPDSLAGIEGNDLVWHDGTRMPISDGVTPPSSDELLNNADIADMFSIPYRAGPPAAAPDLNEDPGRIRYEPFFLKMYGDCKKGE